MVCREIVRAGEPSREEQTLHKFVVEVDADADVLTRVAIQLAYANVAPIRVTLVQGSAGTVRMEAEFRGISSSRADLIRRKIEQLSCTIGVELQEIP